MAAYIVFETGHTFGPPMLYPVYRSLAPLPRHVSDVNCTRSTKGLLHSTRYYFRHNRTSASRTTQVTRYRRQDIFYGGSGYDMTLQGSY